ncbi:unnamed protein product [Meganyctiphanes norvegica]|uniref:Uncharacterized protein n=1 Tax=Meganyctiphanes norvegica TaxID=48144 RepID=A0AAV2R572_MEGNR
MYIECAQRNLKSDKNCAFAINIDFESVFSQFWIIIGPQATENYDKGKNKHLRELTSTIANLVTDIALFLKEKFPNDILASKVQKNIYIFGNPKNIPKFMKCKLGNIVHTHNLYTDKCTGTGF